MDHLADAGGHDPAFLDWEQPVYDKTALMQLVREKALEFGEFTLASGKKANYYYSNDKAAQT